MLKNGDAILVYNRFQLRDINTWLSPIVRFFINLWESDKYCKYQHMGVIAECPKDGLLHYYDAKNDGYQDRGVAEDYLFSEQAKKKRKIAIASYKGEFSNAKFIIANSQLVGTKYDFLLTMVSQLFYQASDDRIWIGEDSNKEAKKRVNCSEVYALILNASSKLKVFDNPSKITAKDVYNSKDFIIFEVL